MNTDKGTERALETFRNGYNCAQAVFSSRCEEFGLEPDKAVRIACAFGSGMARKQEVCGAVTGGLMLIGLRQGRGLGEEKAKSEEAYARARGFMDAFEQRHGSLLCRDLIKCDLKTPEGQAFFKSNDLLHTVCAKCVASAAELA